MFYDVMNGDEGLGTLFKPLAVRARLSSICLLSFQRCSGVASLRNTRLCTAARRCQRRKQSARLLTAEAGHAPPAPVWRPRAACCAQISPRQSVSDQLAYLATASQSRDNGRFVDNLGNTMEW